MSIDFTVIMAIAILEAMVIGVLLCDRLGLINKTKVNENPNDNQDNANKSKNP